MRSVVIFTDYPGWHGARLREAFAERGVESRFVSLRDCAFSLANGGSGIAIPGCEGRLPDGVFVRGVPGGSLEQVVLRLDLLHALQEAGVPVCNDGRAIERTVDKAMTSFVLARAGIPTPPTWVTESESAARDVVRSETEAGRELVLKPLFGSQGTGLKRIAAIGELPPAQECSGVYYLQRYVEPGPSGWYDWRAFVIGGAVVAAMIRRGITWISNVAQGATCEAAEPDADVREHAERACRALRMDYAGVDLIRDRDGKIHVVEVNGIPAWRGLQSVSTVSIAHRLVEFFLARHARPAVLHSVA